MSDATLTDAELTECAELLEPLLSLRATALVAEVRESRVAIAALTAERDHYRSIAEAGVYVTSETVEARVVEAIADFVGDFMDCEPVGDWRLIPRQIRAGEWKDKP